MITWVLHPILFDSFVVRALPSSTIVAAFFSPHASLTNRFMGMGPKYLQKTPAGKSLA